MKTLYVPCGKKKQLFGIDASILLIIFLHQNIDDKSMLWIVAGISGMISFFLTIAVFSIQKQKNTLQNMYRKRNNEMQILLLEKLGIVKDIVLLNPKQTSPLKFMKDVDMIISKYTMQNFVDITNELYPDFTRKLKDNFPNANLSEQETGVCCLILCGFSNKELALFIHRKKDTQAVEKIKNRIRKKLTIPAYRDIQKFLLAHC